MSKQKENKKMMGYRIAAWVMASLMILGSIAGTILLILN